MLNYDLTRRDELLSSPMLIYGNFLITTGSEEVRKTTWIVSAAQKKRNVVAFFGIGAAKHEICLLIHSTDKIPIEIFIGHLIILSCDTFFLCLPDCTTENHNQSELMWKKSIVQRQLCVICYFCCWPLLSLVSTQEEKTHQSSKFSHISKFRLDCDKPSSSHVRHDTGKIKAEKTSNLSNLSYLI